MQGLGLHGDGTGHGVGGEVGSLDFDSSLVSSSSAPSPTPISNESPPAYSAVAPAAAPPASVFFPTSKAERARRRAARNIMPFGHDAPPTRLSSSDEEREGKKEKVREGRYRSRRKLLVKTEAEADAEYGMKMDLDMDSDDGDDRGADSYSQDSSDSDGEDGFVGRGRRRLSVTTEAKRRTSIEDDDEDGLDGVVHVGMVEVGTGEGDGEVVERGEGDEELVEIQHTEIKDAERK